MPAPVDITDPFRALSDPTRRAILSLLSGGALPVRVIAARFPAISRPAVSKHLRILREGGLVAEERSGRERYYSLELAVVGETLDWMAAVHRRALGGRGARRGAPGRPAAMTPSAGSRSRSASAQKETAARRNRGSEVEPEMTPPPTPRSPRGPTTPKAVAEGDDWKAW